MGLFDFLNKSSYNNVLKTVQKRLDEVNSFSKNFVNLKDTDFPKKTKEFQKRLKSADGDKLKEKQFLEEILPEAFALVREAMNRVWKERHYDVQVIGSIVLHQGMIAEMKTGEGKTIVATLPLYLNALSGCGVHLITVNDYLSKHQGEGMGEVYNFLGMSTGVVQSNQISYKFVKTHSYKHYSECDGKNLITCDRAEAYAADVTYGTNNEFGFDYLRDNMAPSLDKCVQKELNFAIVDEVDSILIDEARTPLIISSQAEESASTYQQFAGIIPILKDIEDYTVDEKDRAVNLTDKGTKKIEEILNVENLYGPEGVSLVHYLEQALKAHTLFKRDKDYVVKEGEIIIVDEFTGRLMVGRRYSEGLHQAIEAKENVDVKKESQTLATISFQNLFRLYGKLSGMTGTAATEREEFFKIYQLDVVEIPTNQPVIRDDKPDQIYKTNQGKFDAIIKDVIERTKKGQPVLIGTVSVEKNELVSKLLKHAGVKHEILNAKNHSREAKIIKIAGNKGSITVATNMAGRGTDIKLEAGVTDLGGLSVIATERHDARRIDNQLRGRSGRQGDPGESQFYISLEDDLMRIFGGDKLKNMMDRLGLPEDQPIENKMISRSIESAQKKVEGHNFDTRKHLVEYDDVINRHREVIYKKRRRILELNSSFLRKQESSNEIPDQVRDDKDFLREEIEDIVENLIERIFDSNLDDEKKIKAELGAIFGKNMPVKIEKEKVKEFAKELYKERLKLFGEDLLSQVEKSVYLRVIDMLWVEHLTTMDDLRTGIGLRGYGQRDPLVEYKQEAHKMFQELLSSIETNIAHTIFKIQVQAPPTQPIKRRPLEYHKPNEDDVGGLTDEAEELHQNDKSQMTNDKQNVNAENSKPEKASGATTVIREPGGRSIHDRMMDSAGSQGTIKSNKKVGRNVPCPCGSGKKYKKCCGK